MPQRLSRAPVILSVIVLLLAGVRAKAEDCPGLLRMKLDHAAVTAAGLITAGSPVTPAAGETPQLATVDYCRVQVTSRPTGDSDIRLEVWIPSGAAWNRKFEQVGNGGFAGGLPYGHMAQILALGYAVAGTDDGHQSREMIDGSWAIHHPEKITDYGWRAIHETTLAATRILRRLKSTAAAKAYFVGCSDGGREALMMAQRFPASFDGIVAGAPAYAMTRLLTSGALRSPELAGNAGHLGAAQLALLQHHALEACGQGERYLKDPRQCRVDLASLTCTGPAADDCLSAAQVKTAQNLYEDLTDPATGKSLYGAPPGAEGVKGSWDVWLAGKEAPTQSAAYGFTWNYLAYMVMQDPKLDLARVSRADMVRGERQYAPIMDSDSADLKAFKAHGGKLLQYHGGNDPIIPASYSMEYRLRLAAETGGVNDFYRLYVVPGMLHCGGGDAPTRVDWQKALEDWVERAIPPGPMTAADGTGGTQVLRPVNNP